jgi:hypothetical protein
VEELLSRAKRPGAPLVAEATITAERAGYRLDVSAQHGEERLRRTVHAGACDELADAAALILALWIDPELLGEPQQSETAPVPTTPGSPPPPAPAEPTTSPTARAPVPVPGPAPADPSAPRLIWRVIAGPVVDYGSLPTLAPGLEVCIRLLEGLLSSEILLRGGRVERRALGPPLRSPGGREQTRGKRGQHDAEPHTSTTPQLRSRSVGTCPAIPAALRAGGRFPAVLLDGVCCQHAAAA